MWAGNWITVITQWSMLLWTHFDGLRTKLLLMTFYDFLTRHFKKRKKSCFFEIWKKHKIRILEHWFTVTIYVTLTRVLNFDTVTLNRFSATCWRCFCRCNARKHPHIPFYARPTRGNNSTSLIILFISAKWTKWNWRCLCVCIRPSVRPSVVRLCALSI